MGPFYVYPTSIAFSDLQLMKASGVHPDTRAYYVYKNNNPAQTEFSEEHIDQPTNITTSSSTAFDDLF